MYLAAALPVAIGGLSSAIFQGRTAVAGISIVAKRPSESSKAIISTTLVEFYALLSFIGFLLGSSSDSGALIFLVYRFDLTIY